MPLSPHACCSAGYLPGAQISLTSRSGSNEAHGSLSAGLRNELLNSNDWFANQNGDTRAPQRFQDYAATLGGPLRRNRTFIFLSYEGMRIAQPFVGVQPVPSIPARESAPAWVQPVLNLFPAPNGSDLGNGLAEWIANTSRPSRLDIGSVRIDHAVTSRLTAFGRFSVSPSATEFGSSPVDSLTLDSRSLTLGLTLRATSSLVFDLRLNAASATENSVWLPATPNATPACYQFSASTPCDSLARLSIAGVGQVLSGPEGERRQSQYQVNQTGAWNRGAHFFQFGADYLRLAPVRHDAGAAVSYLANSLADLAYFTNVWAANTPAQNVSAVVKQVSLFADDTWRLASRLTLTYGVRWELSPAPTATAAATFLDPTLGSDVSLQRPIWPSSYTNLAPRLGIAYRLTKDGRTVIRAGAGAYFDSSLSLATDLINGGPLAISQISGSLNSTFPTVLKFGFLPNLHIPLVVLQWNGTSRQRFRRSERGVSGCVRSAGGDLIRREVGGAGSVPTELLALATNEGWSKYHSLQAQYRRRLSRGFEALASYAWSHSIDNSSTDAALQLAPDSRRLRIAPHPISMCATRSPRDSRSNRARAPLYGAVGRSTA